ncbi:MAG: GNAT family N-acetyltransferase [Flavobacteriales bacterium]|nr:GNAT family N-acetyltransferase [Flavobacteriales bacterium]
MNNYITFQSERLIIRPTLEKDAKLIYQLMNSPKFIKHVGDRQVHSVEDAEKYIQDKMLPQLNSLGYSNFSLINKKNSAKIGICGLYDREGLDGIDIGFGILPEYEGLGYAFESSSRLIKAGFEELEISEIKAISNKKNISSQSLLFKLGFKFE